jgi:hypothetical protein
MSPPEVVEAKETAGASAS